MLYQCPLCSESLIKQQSTYKCRNNHQFDVAKEGYVNLIPANKKRSKNPGDNIEMMQARRRFLNSHYYQPLLDTVSKICAEQLTGETHRLLDIGCGEGYYTNGIEQLLNSQNKAATVYGLDISKVAIRYAAKRYPLCRFSVASSQMLPFQSDSLSLILRIYAPCNTAEMNRCVEDNGSVVTVTPAARHLYQLRELIYDKVHLHDETAEEIEGFTLAQEEKLSYEMNLKGEDALDLLQMTPFAWKATDETRSHLKRTQPFNCETDFMIRVYKKG